MDTTFQQIRAAHNCKLFATDLTKRQTMRMCTVFLPATKSLWMCTLNIGITDQCHPVRQISIQSKNRQQKVTGLEIALCIFFGFCFLVIKYFERCVPRSKFNKNRRRYNVNITRGIFVLMGALRICEGSNAFAGLFASKYIFELWRTGYVKKLILIIRLLSVV